MPLPEGGKSLGMLAMLASYLNEKHNNIIKVPNKSQLLEQQLFFRINKISTPLEAVLSFTLQKYPSVNNPFVSI